MAFPVPKFRSVQGPMDENKSSKPRKRKSPLSALQEYCPEFIGTSTASKPNTLRSCTQETTFSKTTTIHPRKRFRRPWCRGHLCQSGLMERLAPLMRKVTIAELHPVPRCHKRKSRSRRTRILITGIPATRRRHREAQP